MCHERVQQGSERTLSLQLLFTLLGSLCRHRNGKDSIPMRSNENKSIDSNLLELFTLRQGRNTHAIELAYKQTTISTSREELCNGRGWLTLEAFETGLELLLLALGLRLGVIHLQPHRHSV